MILLAALVGALWSSVAHAGESVIPLPDTWWEMVLGIAALLGTGGWGGSSILQRLTGGKPGEVPDELTQRLAALEDRARAGREQAETAAREARIRDLEAKCQAWQAEIVALRDMVGKSSADMSATMGVVMAALKRLEGA